MPRVKTGRGDIHDSSPGINIQHAAVFKPFKSRAATATRDSLFDPRRSPKSKSGGNNRPRIGKAAHEDLLSLQMEFQRVGKDAAGMLEFRIVAQE
jgi:hypothetical protein